VTLGIGVDELRRIEAVIREIGLKYLVPDFEDFVKESFTETFEEVEKQIKLGA